MQFAIEILSVTRERGVTKANKAYEFLNVAYKKDGKIDGKKIYPFGDKKVFDTCAAAQAGQLYTVTSEKNGDFWEWTSVSLGADAPQTSTEATGTASSGVRQSPKSNYETPEERAARQVMIVKQSSISNAISLLKTEKHTPAVEDVLKTAQTFVDYVLGLDVKNSTPKVDTSSLDIDDDLPWDNK